MTIKKIEPRSFVPIYSFLLRLSYHIPNSILYSNEAKCVNTILSMQDLKKNIEPLLKKRLCYIIRTALQNVPYYKELKINLCFKDITEENAIQALEQFPYLDKSKVMENPELFVNRKYKISKLMIDTSGGSTGTGIKLYSNFRTKIIERCFFDYKWKVETGFNQKSKLIRIGLVPTKNASKNPFIYMAGRLFISPYYVTEKYMDLIFKNFVDYETEYIHSYPSCLEFISNWMISNNLTLRNLRGIFLASERVSEKQLDIIQKAFIKVPIVFHYGLREKSNLAWGSYINNEIIYNFEKVYGVTENYLYTDGRREIVGTSYWDDIMPLIRYKTQDIGSILNGTMSNLDGRNQEYLIAKDGQLIPGFTVSIDKFTWDYVTNFQIIQNEPGKIEFHILPRKNFTKEIEELILKSQNKKWGNFFEMKIILIREMPRTVGGKFRLIINNVL